MSKIIYAVLLCMIYEANAWRKCRTLGGTCHKSLKDFPCNDPRGSLIKEVGLPICSNKRPYCCIKAPGRVCHTDNKYGPKAYCMLPSSTNNLTCVDTSAKFPNQTYVPGETPFGLHMKYADHKCKDIKDHKMNYTVFEKTRCCTVAVQCAWSYGGFGPADGWCGPAVTSYWGNKTCRNGFHYPKGDNYCSHTANAPLCCTVGPQSTPEPITSTILSTLSTLTTSTVLSTTVTPRVVTDSSPTTETITTIPPTKPSTTGTTETTSATTYTAATETTATTLPTTPYISSYTFSYHSYTPSISSNFQSSCSFCSFSDNKFEDHFSFNVALESFTSSFS